LGLIEYTAFRLLTILHQGDIGKSQIDKDGHRNVVKPCLDALAMNIGDMLHAQGFLSFSESFTNMCLFFVFLIKLPQLIAFW